MSKSDSSAAVNSEKPTFTEWVRQKLVLGLLYFLAPFASWIFWREMYNSKNSRLHMEK